MLSFYQAGCTEMPVLMRLAASSIGTQVSALGPPDVMMDHDSISSRKTWSVKGHHGSEPRD